MGPRTEHNKFIPFGKKCIINEYVSVEYLDFREWGTDHFFLVEMMIFL